MARRKATVIPDELLDQLLAGRDPQAALGRDGLIHELKRALAERALNAEMDRHLDGEPTGGRANSRDGYGHKTFSPRRASCRSRRDMTGCPPSIVRNKAVYIALGVRAAVGSADIPCKGCAVFAVGQLQRRRR